MNYKLLLKWSLAPTILLSLICIINLGLTTVYWIVGDWVVVRGIEVPSGTVFRGDAATVFDVRITIIEYLPPATDSTLVSATLGIFAAVVCFLAWYKLRRSDMDEEHNLPRRRFWLAFPLVALTMTCGAALGSIILHYTQKGNDRFGCTSELQSNGDRIMYCTREQGACGVLPEFKRFFNEAGQRLTGEDWIGSLCGQTQAVKWLQLLVIFICVACGVLLCLYARVRSKTRYERVGGKKGKEVDFTPPQDWS